MRMVFFYYSFYTYEWTIQNGSNIGLLTCGYIIVLDYLIHMQFVKWTSMPHFRFCIEFDLTFNSVICHRSHMRFHSIQFNTKMKMPNVFIPNRKISLAYEWNIHDQYLCVQNACTFHCDECVYCFGKIRDSFFSTRAHHFISFYSIPFDMLWI